MNPYQYIQHQYSITASVLVFFCFCICNSFVYIEISRLVHSSILSNTGRFRLLSLQIFFLRLSLSPGALVAVNLWLSSRALIKMILLVFASFFFSVFMGRDRPLDFPTAPFSLTWAPPYCPYITARIPPRASGRSLWKKPGWREGAGISAALDRHSLSPLPGSGGPPLPPIQGQSIQHSPSLFFSPFLPSFTLSFPKQNPTTQYIVFSNLLFN